MRLIRNILAWIAVAGVIIVMAPIVLLIHVTVVVVTIPIAGFVLVAYAIENGLAVRWGGSERWFVVNTRLTAILGVITGTPALLMQTAIENVYCLIHS